MPTTTDLLQHAIDGDALEFNNTFADIMADRINARIDDYREVVARDIYGEDDSDDVGEDEFSDEDTDFEDSDDDLDFDDDLDIDLDLEGLDTDDEVA